MKKILLSLSSLAMIATPVVAVVSCGDKDGDKKTNAQQNKEQTKPAESQESVMLKDVINRAFSSIKIEDIKEAKILHDGYDIKMGTLITKMDYAVQYVFNKDANINLYPFNEKVNEGTKLIFAVRKTDGLSKVILENPVTHTNKVHTITGSPKNFIIEMLKKQGMDISFTAAPVDTQAGQQSTAEHHEIAVTTVSTTPVAAPVHVQRIDISNYANKITGKTFQSRKNANQIHSIVSNSITPIELGIEIPVPPSGVRVVINRKEGQDGKFTCSFFQGNTKLGETIDLIVSPLTTPQEIKDAFSREFHSTKTKGQLDRLKNGLLTPDDLGIVLPEMPEHWTAVLAKRPNGDLIAAFKYYGDGHDSTIIKLNITPLGVPIDILTAFKAGFTSTKKKAELDAIHNGRLQARDLGITLPSMPKGFTVVLNKRAGVITAYIMYSHKGDKHPIVLATEIIQVTPS